MASDVQVVLDVLGKDKVTGAFKEVKKEGENLSESFKEMGKKLLEMYFSYEALVKVVETFKEAIEMGGKLADLSEQTGISAGKLVVLQRAFQDNGMEAEELGKTVNKMQKFLEAAGEEGSAAAIKLNRIGLSADQLKGMQPDELFRTIGMQIASIQDPTEKAADAMEIFGKAGGRTLALFANYDESLKNAAQSQGTLAQIMDQSAESFHKVEIGFNEIGAKGKEFAAGALSDVIDSLGILTNKLAKMDAAKMGQEFFKNLSEPVKALLELLASGEFRKSFELFGELFKLEAEKMINQVVILGQTIGAVLGTAFKETFSPGSEILRLTEDAFSVMGLWLEKSMLSAIGEVASSIPLVGNIIKQQILDTLPKVTQHLADATEDLKMSASGASIQADLLAKNIADVAVNTYSTAKGWIDIADQQKKVNDLATKGLALAKEKRQIEGEKPKTEKPHEAGPGYAGSRPAAADMGGGGGSGPAQNPVYKNATAPGGIFNTSGLSEAAQNQLSRQSTLIEKYQLQPYDRNIQQYNAQGNFMAANQVQGQRAQAQNQLARSALDYDLNNASQRENFTTKDISILQGMSKEMGPDGSGSGAGGAKGKEKADPLSAILKILTDHLIPIDNKLPIQALT